MSYCNRCGERHISAACPTPADFTVLRLENERLKFLLANLLTDYNENLERLNEMREDDGWDATEKDQSAKEARFALEGE